MPHVTSLSIIVYYYTSWWKSQFVSLYKNNLVYSCTFPHYSEFLNLLVNITKTFILNLKFLNSHESMEHYQPIYSS